MKKVLVGVDLNTSYVWLVVRAVDLAKCLGAKIDLVYATAGEPAGKRAEHERALDRLMEHVDAGQRGARLVRDGDPAGILREMSAHYDVMVVGPREPTGWRRLVEKPMAVRVIGDARCPVFIPRTEEPRTNFARVLVGVDLNAADHAARLADAAAWALALGARLDAVYCEANPAHQIEGHSAREAAQRRWKAQRAEQRDRLSALMNKRVDPAARGEALLADDTPAVALVDMSHDYDLVVVGTADVRSSSIMLGSVAIDVVRHASCDVLTLPV